MSEMEMLFQKIEGYRDEIIELQANLTSRVALGPDNGGSGEVEKAEYLKEILKKLKPDQFEEIKAPDERAERGYRPNLVGMWEGEDKAPRVWVLTHMDIVPPGDSTLWETDPYQVKVDGDRITGRGVQDNQHSIVSSYLALKAIKESAGKLKRSVGLVLVADEETGSKFGLDYLLKKRGDIFTPDDLIIVPDGGNKDGSMIEIAEKSMLWLKFIITGRQCHASRPDSGRNSLYGAARLILALEKLKEEFDIYDGLFSPPLSTFEPTKMEANVQNINTIPGKDIFYIDCRILPSYGVDDIIASANSITEDLARDLGLSINSEAVYRQDAVNPTPADAPVVNALTRAIKKVTGIEAKPIGIGGGTVAAFFRQAGLPAAVWQTDSDTAHQPNEYCLISNIITDTKVFASLYMDEPNDEGV